MSAFPENIKAGRLKLRRHETLSPELLLKLESLGRSALSESALDRWMIPVIASFGLLYTAELNEDIAGAAEIIRSLNEGVLYLEGLYIRPELQNMGYGTELLNGLIDILCSSRFSRLLATVDRSIIEITAVYRFLKYCRIRSNTL